MSHHDEFENATERRHCRADYFTAKEAKTLQAWAERYGEKIANDLYRPRTGTGVPFSKLMEE